MKKQILGVAALALSFNVYASGDNAWMRYAAISPDGNQIAFSFKGDIYTVPLNGGRALQITTNPAHDTQPIWSPDGKQIAFASDRMGSMDIYVVDKEGGIPQRLTTHSGNETPITFKDNDHVLFQANILPSTDDMQFASGQFPQVYEVSTAGGRPVMFSSMPMENISLSADGNSTAVKEECRLLHRLNLSVECSTRHLKGKVARSMVCCGQIILCRGNRDAILLGSYRLELRADNIALRLHLYIPILREECKLGIDILLRRELYVRLAEGYQRFLNCRNTCKSGTIETENYIADLPCRKASVGVGNGCGDSHAIARLTL